MQVLAKGERLPQYKYKQLSYMTAYDLVYNLYDSQDKFIAKVFVPRHRGMPRKLEMAK